MPCYNLRIYFLMRYAALFVCAILALTAMSIPANAIDMGMDPDSLAISARDTGLLGHGGTTPVHGRRDDEHLYGRELFDDADAALHHLDKRGKKRAVNSADVRKGMSLAVQSAYDWEDSFDYLMSLNDNDKRLPNAKQNVRQKTLVLAGDLDNVVGMLNQDGTLHDKAIRRMGPLLQSIQETMTHLMDTMRNNKEKVDRYKVAYIPQCTIDPFRTAWVAMNTVLDRRGNDASRIAWKPRTDDIVRHFDDLAKVYTPFKNAKDCMNAQKASGAKWNKDTDLSRLFP